MHPQPGIFAQGTLEHSYLELDLLPDLTVSALLQAMAALSGPESPVGGVSIVLALRPELWAQVSGTAGLARSFTPVDGDGFLMPATQHDAWLWIAGGARDVVFDSTLTVVRALAPFARVASGINGWVYQHDRDLTGFVDGTENPSALQAPGVAIAPDGTSVVLVQQWRHLPSWETLAVAEQELVIGRTKDDSTELADDVMPADSHVSRTVVEQDGEDLETSWRPDQPTVPEVCGLQHSVGLTAGSSDAGAAHQASTECRARSRAMRRGTTERLATEARGVPTARRSCRRSAGRPTACWRRA